MAVGGNHAAHVVCGIEWILDPLVSGASKVQHVGQIGLAVVGKGAQVGDVRGLDQAGQLLLVKDHLALPAVDEVEVTVNLHDLHPEAGLGGVARTRWRPQAGRQRRVTRRGKKPRLVHRPAETGAGESDMDGVRRGGREQGRLRIGDGGDGAALANGGGLRGDVRAAGNNGHAVQLNGEGVGVRPGGARIGNGDGETVIVANRRPDHRRRVRRVIDLEDLGVRLGRT